MTDEQKYAELLKELGQLIADKNMTIVCQRITIDDLKKQLGEMDAKLAEAKKEIARRCFTPAEEGGAA